MPDFRTSHGWPARIAAIAMAATALTAVTAIGVATAAPSKGVAMNTLTAKEKKEGWKLLFNGKDFVGWRVYRGADVVAPWVIDHGTIECTGKGQDIITADEYGDFELSAEWKISPKGNSGIIYLVKEDPSAPNTYNTGPEMQVLDNDGHPDGKLPSHRAGALYDLVAPPDGVVKKVGEWNQARIIVHKGHIEHWLNGKKVAEAPYGDQAWADMVAKSKFKTMPLFGKAATGHIALQDHDGDKVWYRNLKIRKL